MHEVAASAFPGARLEAVEERPHLLHQLAGCRIAQLELQPGLRGRCAPPGLPDQSHPGALAVVEIDDPPEAERETPRQRCPSVSAGLGFGVGTFQGHRWLGHNGGAPGANVEATAFPDDRTAVVILSNRDPPAATALFRQVRVAVFDPAQASCASDR
jgi:CubicO group peptidase (beta-lactamase class C family)